MPPRTPSPAAGGVLIAAGAIAGTVAGFLAQQVTAGFLLGVAAGTGAAILIWLDQKRR